MIDYQDFVARVDAGLTDKNLRLWRHLTFPNGRPISLYVSGEKGMVAGVSLHLFITYIKNASPDDFERFSRDCIEYALKANTVPAVKKLITTCLILPCIATHTTFRELVLAAEKSKTLTKGDGADKSGGLKSNFLHTAAMPCLLNLTTHKSFHSGQKGFTDAVYKTGEEFLVKTVVAANAPPDSNPARR